MSSFGRAAAVAILAGAIGLATTPLSAKHLAPQPDSDAEPQPSPAPAPAPADAPAAGHGTVIKGQFLETHDLLGDANDPANPMTSAIQWTHDFTIVLSGKNHVSEKWNNVRASRGASTIVDHGARNRMRNRSWSLPFSTAENGVTIGANAGQAVWHVLGDKKLQRIFPGQHFIMMMNIEVGAGAGSSLEVKYLRQEGFSTIVMRMPDGLPANFSLPRVESASCTIEGDGRGDGRFGACSICLTQKSRRSAHAEDLRRDQTWCCVEAAHASSAASVGGASSKANGLRNCRRQSRLRSTSLKPASAQIAGQRSRMVVIWR